jgi:uncharacterized membrane protein YeaQ/YmgE (transglycosylase-associated protein family)
VYNRKDSVSKSATILILDRCSTLRKTVNMKLFKFLNKELRLTKTQVYVTFFGAIIIGILLSFYGQDILAFVGFDFLEENFLLISFILTIISSVIVLVNLLFSRRGYIVKSNSFEKQINELEQALSGIKSLELFIEEHKNKLLQNQKTIDELNLEKEKLQPIVESNQKIVASILNAHSENQSKNIFKERVVGFFLGLLSSSIVSLLIWYFTK